MEKIPETIYEMIPVLSRSALKTRFCSNNAAIRKLLRGFLINVGAVKKADSKKNKE
jgi:hypothetical protein